MPQLLATTCQNLGSSDEIVLKLWLQMWTLMPDQFFHLFVITLWVISTGIQGRSQTLYTALCNGVISHGAQIRGLQVSADHTRKNKCSQNQCLQNLHPLCSVLDVFYLHAQTAVYAGDICTWRTVVILISGKPRSRPPIWAPCRGKNGPGSGISLVYLWWSVNHSTEKLLKRFCV